MIAFNKINNLIDALNDSSVKLNIEAYEDCGGFFQLKTMDQTQTKKKLIKAIFQCFGDVLKGLIWMLEQG